MTSNALIQCINLFASQHSNPVLSVLPDNGIVEFKRKYPDSKLLFSNIGIRAYYHCHTSLVRPNKEHGHFHLFLQTNEKQWSHLAGLSMDCLGQPLEWFTVNHWVTGETWRSANQLKTLMESLFLKEPQGLKLAEFWMLAMMSFYKNTLNDILQERDRQIETLTQEHKIDTVMQDRSIYLLSQREINLLSDLESCSNLNSKQKHSR